MRRGQRDKWKYDGFPRNSREVSILSSSDDGAPIREDFTIPELVETSVERAYEKKFPHTQTSDNAASLERFRKLSGKMPKITKTRDDVPGGQKTRREETYERLAEKMSHSKWFNDRITD